MLIANMAIGTPNECLASHVYHLVKSCRTRRSDTGWCFRKSASCAC